MLNWQCRNIIYSYLILLTICIYIVQTYGFSNQLTEAHIEKHKISISSEGGPIRISEKNEPIEQENTLQKSVIANTNATLATNATVQNVSKETMHGREGIDVKNTNNISQSTSAVSHDITGNTTVKASSTTVKEIPVSEPDAITTKATEITNKNLSSTTEKTPIKLNKDAHVKGRKGVGNFTEETTSTTEKPKKKKPTVTKSDDEPYPPVKKIQNNSSDFKNKEGYVGTKYFKKGPDYVLPIVLTILAVPLVAIVIAVLYKRGSEWWHHRHYRRMDFLIDGMYNN